MKNRFLSIGDEQCGLVIFKVFKFAADNTTVEWVSIDPLAEKYCAISPYAFCAGNHVNLVDPDGRIVIPKGTDELNIIRNTIPESDREYVQLNANGHYWTFAKTGRDDKRIKSEEHISYLMIKFTEKRIYCKWSEYDPCR